MIVSIELIVKFVPVFFDAAFVVVVVTDDAVVGDMFDVVDGGCVSVPPFLAVVVGVGAPAIVVVVVVVVVVVDAVDAVVVVIVVIVVVVVVAVVVVVLVEGSCPKTSATFKTIIARRKAGNFLKYFILFFKLIIF